MGYFLNKIRNIASLSKNDKGNFMIKDISLPKLGSSMVEGMIVAIPIEKGQTIHKGQTIFEIETDKASLDMDAPEDGVVEEILVSIDQTVKVGEVVARIRVAGNDEEAEKGNFEIVRLAKLGETVEQVIVTDVLVDEGDSIQKGKIIAEVETDKAALDIVCENDGYVRKVLISEGDTVKIGEPIIIVGDENSEIPAEILSQIKDNSGFAIPDGYAAIKLAKMGETMQSAIVSAFLCDEGEEVEIGDAVLEVETDKAALEIETQSKGCLQSKVAEVGEECAVGAILAIIKTDPNASQIADDLVARAIEENKKLKNENNDAQADIFSAEAYKNIHDQDLSLEEISRSLHNERQLHRGEVIELSRVQKIIGERMVFSKQNIPCFYLNTLVDMTKICEFRQKLNETATSKVSFNDLIIKALAEACKEFKLMTGQVAGDHIRLTDEVSVGLAVDTGEALLVPVCKDAGNKTIEQIAKSTAELIAKAKAGKISQDDLSGACITVSSLGNLGIDWFIPIVPPGQASIIGVGKIKEELVKKGDELINKKVLTITISVDHKVVNGAYAAQFLDRVRQLLETPEKMV